MRLPKGCEELRFLCFHLSFFLRLHGNSFDVLPWFVLHQEGASALFSLFRHCCCSYFKGHYTIVHFHLFYVMCVLLYICLNVICFTFASICWLQEGQASFLM